MIYLGQVRKKKRIPLRKAENLAEKIYHELEPMAEFITVAGSIRRQRPEIGDIEFVVLPWDLDSFLAELKHMNYSGGSRKRETVVKGIKIEIYIAHAPEEVGAMLFTYTGDYLWNISMRSIAKRRGWKLDQYGIKDVATGDWILQSPYEEDFMGVLGVDYHTPEERSLASRPKKKASMGALGPRDWSPRREVPGHNFKFSAYIQKLNWEADKWREPDLKDGMRWVWYGPGGKEGDDATEAEWIGDGWRVAQYSRVDGQPQPEDILKTTTWVAPNFLAEALWLEGGIPISAEVISDDPDEWGRFAVGLGVADQNYSGGDEDWVDSLP